MTSPSPKYFTDIIRPFAKYLSDDELSTAWILRSIPVWDSFVLRASTDNLVLSENRETIKLQTGKWISASDLLRGSKTRFEREDIYRDRLGIDVSDRRATNSGRMGAVLEDLTTPRSFFGNRACCKLAVFFLTQGPDYIPKRSTDFESIRKIVSASARLQSYASRANPTLSSSTTSAIFRNFKAWENLERADHFRDVYSSGRLGSHQKKMRIWHKVGEGMPPAIEPSTYMKERRLSSMIKYYRIDRSMLIDWKTFRFFLTERDIKDLTEMLMALANYQIYTLEYARTSIQSKHRESYLNCANQVYQKFLDLLEIASGDEELANKVGTYFEVVHSILLARFANDGVVDNEAVMMEKFREKGLSGFGHPQTLIDALGHIPLKEALDLLHIYKCYMYPYFCFFQQVDRQYRLHLENNPKGLEVRESMEDQETWLSYRLLQRYTFIEHFRDKYHYSPGRVREGWANSEWGIQYADRGLPLEFWREAEHIDLRGVLPYSISDEAYVSRMPDSASAPRRDHYFKGMEQYRNAPRYQKSNLLHILEDPETVNEKEELLKLAQGKYEWSRYIATGVRSERHKADGRMFFIMNTVSKVLYSSFEYNIRLFAEGTPGYMQGKSSLDKLKDMEHIWQHRVTATHNLFVSMDMSKWSPQMNVDLQQYQHEFWAEIFDNPGILALGSLIQDCRFFFRYGATYRSYENPGADLEGIRGATLTYMHLCIMRTIIRLAREKELISGAAGFLTLIDDGLLRVGVGMGANWEQRALDFVNFMSDCYRAVGLKVSFDKTYVSRRMFVMLNDLFIHGVKLHMGAKAFVKMGLFERGIADSFADINNAHSATASGAIKAGSPPFLCMVMYYFYLLKDLYMWAGREIRSLTILESSLLLLLPISMGGLGAKPLSALFSPVGGNPYLAGVAFLRIWSLAEPGNAKIALRLANQAISPLSALDFLRDPTQVHVQGSRIMTQRVKAKCLERAILLAVNPILQDMLSFEDKEYYDALATELRRKSPISILEVSSEWGRTKRAKAEATINKFQNSPAILQLLGMREVSRLRFVHRRDVRKTILQFRYRI